MVGIVSQLTGYPPDLLDVGLDLEADLGVDTVEQAEIFAAIREHYGVARDDSLNLREFPTLTHAIGWIRDKAGIPAPAAEAPVAQPAPPSGTEAPAAARSEVPSTPTITGDIAATDRIPRRVPVPALRAKLADCVPTGVTLGPGARVAVMRDEGGVADALITRLTRLGVDVLAMRPDDDIDTMLADAPVDGVYWLTALDDEGPWRLDLAGWHEALRCRVRNLYTTMRRLYERSPFLVVATRLGGYHGYDTAGATCPLGGAVTGFAKAYRRERADALVKAVDFPVDPKRKKTSAALADVLIDETLRDPGCVEVGHAAGRRWGIGLVERPFPDMAEEAGEVLGPEPVFLVTGAAGSIVSAITADLAAAWRGTFHLLDLTPQPDPADPDLRRYTEDREGLKTELAARMRERGEPSARGATGTAVRHRSTRGGPKRSALDPHHHRRHRRHRPDPAAGAGTRAAGQVGGLRADRGHPRPRCACRGHARRRRRRGAVITRLTRLGVDVLAVRPDDDIDTMLADAPVDGVYWLTALDDEGP